MKRLYITDFDWGDNYTNSFLQFSSNMFPDLKKRGNLHVSLFAPALKKIGSYSLQSDGLLGVIAEDVPAPESTVILLQEVSGVFVEVGRQTSTDGSWEFNTLGNGETIAIALKDGYNAGIVSGLIPGIADE